MANEEREQTDQERFEEEEAKLINQVDYAGATGVTAPSVRTKAGSGNNAQPGMAGDTGDRGTAGPPVLSRKNSRDIAAQPQMTPSGQPPEDGPEMQQGRATLAGIASLTNELQNRKGPDAAALAATIKQGGEMPTLTRQPTPGQAPNLANLDMSRPGAEQHPQNIRAMEGTPDRPADLPPQPPGVEDPRPVDPAQATQAQSVTGDSIRAGIPPREDVASTYDLSHPYDTEGNRMVDGPQGDLVSPLGPEVPEAGATTGGETGLGDVDHQAAIREAKPTFVVNPSNLEQGVEPVEVTEDNIVDSLYAMASGKPHEIGRNYEMKRSAFADYDVQTDASGREYVSYKNIIFLTPQEARDQVVSWLSKKHGPSVAETKYDAIYNRVLEKLNKDGFSGGKGWGHFVDDDRASGKYTPIEVTASPEQLWIAHQKNPLKVDGKPLSGDPATQKELIRLLGRPGPKSSGRGISIPGTGGYSTPASPKQIHARRPESIRIGPHISGTNQRIGYKSQLGDKVIGNEIKRNADIWAAEVKNGLGLVVAPDLSLSESQRVVKAHQELGKTKAGLAAGVVPKKWWARTPQGDDQYRTEANRQAAIAEGRRRLEASIDNGTEVITEFLGTQDGKRNKVPLAQFLEAVDNSTLEPEVKDKLSTDAENFHKELSQVKDSGKGAVSTEKYDTLPPSIRDEVTKNTPEQQKALREALTAQDKGKDLLGVASQVSQEQSDEIDSQVQQQRGGAAPEQGGTPAERALNEVAQAHADTPVPGDDETRQRKGSTNANEAPLGEKPVVILNKEGQQVWTMGDGEEIAVNESAMPDEYKDELGTPNEKWEQLTAKGKIAAIGRGVLENMGFGGGIEDINDSGTTTDEWQTYMGTMMGDPTVAAIIKDNPEMGKGFALIAAVGGGTAAKQGSPAYQEAMRKQAVARYLSAGESKGKTKQDPKAAYTQSLNETIASLKAQVGDLEPWEQNIQAAMDKWYPETKIDKARLAEVKAKSAEYAKDKVELARQILIRETVHKMAMSIVHNSPAAFGMGASMTDFSKYVDTGLREKQKELHDNFDELAMQQTIYEQTGELLPDGMSVPAMEKMLPTLLSERRAKEANLKHMMQVRASTRDFKTKSVLSLFELNKDRYTTSTAAGAAASDLEFRTKEMKLKEYQAKAKHQIDQMAELNKWIDRDDKRKQDEIKNQQYDTNIDLAVWTAQLKSKDESVKAAIANGGKIVSGELLDKFAMQKTLIGSLDVLQNMIRSDPHNTATGPVKDAAERVFRVFGGGNVTYGQFRSYAMQVMNTYVFTMTGKQMSKVEVERIKSVLPRPGQGPEMFMGMLKAFRAYAVRNMRDRVKMQILGGYNMTGVAGNMPMTIALPLVDAEGVPLKGKDAGWKYQPATVSQVQRWCYTGPNQQRLTDPDEIAKRFNSLRIAGDDGESLWSPSPLARGPGNSLNPSKVLGKEQRRVGVRLGKKIYGALGKNTAGLGLEGFENMPSAQGTALGYQADPLGLGVRLQADRAGQDASFHSQDKYNQMAQSVIQGGVPAGHEEAWDPTSEWDERVSGASGEMVYPNSVRQE